MTTQSPSGLPSPEQRSFRERQKYFEIEVKQQQMDKPPKRVSLVGEDDLKKMKEEEGTLECARTFGLFSESFLRGRHERAPTPGIQHFQKLDINLLFIRPGTSLK